MEVYVSDQGLTPEGRLKAGTHLCFDEDFLISRPAIDQYQIVKSCISILQDVLFNLEEEVKAEHAFFTAEAEKAVEKLWDRINYLKKQEE